MNSPADDVRVMLEGESSLALTLGENLYVSEMPDEIPGGPGVCVGLYDSGGFPPQPNFTYEYPTVQVQVRGLAGGYMEAYAMAQAILIALNGTFDVTIDSVRYVGVWAMQSPLFVGRDERNRPLFTINFRLHRGDAV